MFAHRLEMFLISLEYFVCRCHRLKMDVTSDMGAGTESSHCTRHLEVCEGWLLRVARQVCASQHHPGYLLGAEMSTNFMRGHTLHFVECLCHTQNGKGVMNILSIWDST